MSLLGSVLSCWRCSSVVTRLVSHVIDMVRLFCEEVSAWCGRQLFSFVTAAVMAFAVERGILFRYTLRQGQTQGIMGPCRRILYRYARARQYERLVFEKEDR